MAPGIDVERDVLARLPFEPTIEGPEPMDQAVFLSQTMGLRQRMLDIRIEDRISYDAETNTLFLDYSGMQVRSEDDLTRIKDAVDAALEPLGRCVHAIVNYDSFTTEDAVNDAYLDLVRYVEERYYIDVSRYTTSGFMRLKLGHEFAARHITSEVVGSEREARRRMTRRAE